MFPFQAIVVNYIANIQSKCSSTTRLNIAAKANDPEQDFQISFCIYKWLQMQFLDALSDCDSNDVDQLSRGEADSVAGSLPDADSATTPVVAGSPSGEAFVDGEATSVFAGAQSGEATPVVAGSPSGEAFVDGEATSVFAGAPSGEATPVVAGSPSGEATPVFAGSPTAHPSPQAGQVGVVPEPPEAEAASNPLPGLSGGGEDVAKADGGESGEEPHPLVAAVAGSPISDVDAEFCSDADEVDLPPSVLQLDPPSNPAAALDDLSDADDVDLPPSLLKIDGHLQAYYGAGTGSAFQQRRQAWQS